MDEIIKRIIELSNEILMVLGNRDHDQVINSPAYLKDSYVNVEAHVNEIAELIKTHGISDGIPNHKFFGEIRRQSNNQIDIVPTDDSNIWWTCLVVQTPAGKIVVGERYQVQSRGTP